MAATSAGCLDGAADLIVQSRVGSQDASSAQEKFDFQYRVSHSSFIFSRINNMRTRNTVENSDEEACPDWIGLDGAFPGDFAGRSDAGRT